jgi:hypothetical protein
MADKRKTGTVGPAGPDGAAPSGGKALAPLYSFRIELRGIKPKIWRRFFCPSDATLDEFHDLIQRVMGWSDSHLHSFVVGDVEYYDEPDAPFPDIISRILDHSGVLAAAAGFGGFPGRTLPSRGVRLSELKLAKGGRLSYTYDFGDCWEHELEVADLDFKPEDPDRRRGCLAGARACPPEECGGVRGYRRLVELLERRGDGERGGPDGPDGPGGLDRDDEELLERFGGDYDPERFDPEAANRGLG